MSERDIFVAARARTDPAARAAFLDGACGGDAALRKRVERLLCADEGPDSLLDVPERGSDEEALSFLEPPGRSDSLGRLGHYEVLEVLGKGGFGIVFRAFDETLQRVVAVKVLAPLLAATSPARRRFLREAQSSARVRHESVVQVHAVEKQPLPYLVMEFIPGETLQQRIDRIGPLEVLEVVRIGRQIAEGLAAAHATGLIHRDVKPANVLIERGPQEHAKLTDFGLARAADDASISQSGLVAGTPMYMSPEQARGERLDHRTDLFSLGSVLYVMTSGRPPFRAAGTLAVLKRVNEDTPRPIPEIIPEAPQWLCDVIAKLQAKGPEDRFQSAQEVADLLARRQTTMQQPPGTRSSPEQATPGTSEMTLDAASPVYNEGEQGEAAPPASVAGRASGRRVPKAGRRLHGRRWFAAAAALLLLFAGLGLTEATGVTQLRGTIVRLFTAEGTLVVETDDPNLRIAVEGEEVIIAGTGVKELRMKPGQYRVQAHRDGKVVTQRLVTVTSNGKEVVRISREVPPPTEDNTGAKVIDPDRKAAIWALTSGGYARLDLVVDGKEVNVGNFNGKEIRSDTSMLPKTPFQLRRLNVNRNPKVSDTGLAVLQGLEYLTVLQLTNTTVTDAALPHLKGCKKLEKLLLYATGVTDAGLRDLEGLSELKLLSLKQTRVSEAAVKKLAGSLPKCRIEWNGPTIEPGANLEVNVCR